MSQSTRAFYDQLAADYHLIYADWDGAIARQAKALRSILRAEAWKGRRVLDLACGIGTQALGFAKMGFEVTASDLSEVSVRRLRREAKLRGLALSAKSADMRSAHAVHGGGYDLVMAMDNAVPHLLSDRDLLKAFRSARECLKPGGLYMVSVRDYAKEPTRGTHLRGYGNALVPFQVWDFHGRHYDLSLYRLDAKDRLRVSTTTYYAIPCNELLSLLREAGFKKAKRSDGKFYQPVLLAQA